MSDGVHGHLNVLNVYLKRRSRELVQSVLHYIYIHLIKNNETQKVFATPT